MSVSAPPALTDTGQRLYDACQTLAQQDAQYGYALALLCSAYAKMVDPIATIVRDPDEGVGGVPGWARVFDVQNVDPRWLPWLAQFVGVDLTGVTDVQSQRNLIQHPVGQNRGTFAAMRANARPTLTGTQTVLLNARVGGNAWQMTASTYVSETPNPTATQQALLAMKPAGVILTYTLVQGGAYSLLAASHPSYSAMEAAHPTYADIPKNPGA